MRIPLTALAVLLLLLTACGGDDDDDGGDGGDAGGIESAETCDEVGAAFLDEIQVLLDELEGMGMADVTGDEQPEAMTDFQANIEEIGAKSDELECTDQEIAEYLEANVDDLEAEGPVAELILQGLQEQIQSGELFGTPIE